MALIERLQLNIDATCWPGKIPMNYVYTAGRAGEKFYKAIKEKGEFIGARCENCNVVYLPPRIFCERCFSRIEGNYVTVPSRGVIHTFTLCYEDYQEKLKGGASIVAFIKMDNTIGGLMHWISGVRVDEIRIGMPVKAVFKSKKDRSGGILDIKHFIPV